MDTLISGARSTRIIESSLLTKVQGGTGGVQLISSDSTLLMEASTAAVSSLKQFVCIDGLTTYGNGASITCNGLAAIKGDMTCDGSVVIAGSLKLLLRHMPSFT